MSWDKNIFDNPEKFGLSIVAVVNDPQANYSFDDTVFWTDGQRVYGAADSGCSCPTPFDNINSIEELEVIPNVDAARNLLKREYTEYRPEDVSEALRAVEAALKGQVN